MANTGLRQPALEAHSRQLLSASAQWLQPNVLARRRDWGVLLLNKHVTIMRISFRTLQGKKKKKRKKETQQQQQSGQASRKAAFCVAARRPCRGICMQNAEPSVTHCSLFGFLCFPYSSRVSTSKVTVHPFKDRALSACMLIYWRLWVASQPQRGSLPLSAGSKNHSFKETNILIVPPLDTVLFWKGRATRPCPRPS